MELERKLAEKLHDQARGMREKKKTARMTAPKL